MALDKGRETHLDEVSVSMKRTGRIQRLISMMLMVAMVLSLLPAAWAENTAQYAYLLIQNNSATRVVNFRRQPNTNDNTNYPVARLPEYWVVQVIGQATGGGTAWYQVRANINVGGGAAFYREGYVMASFVKLMTAAEQSAYLANPANTFNPNTAMIPTQPPAGAPTQPVVQPVTPVPDATPVPMGQTGYIRTIQPNVNLRESPEGRVLNENNPIPLGNVMAYYSLYTVGDYSWALVQYNGQAGYVRSDCFAACDAAGNLLNPTSQPQPYPTVPVVSYSPVIVPTTPVITQAPYVTSVPPTAYFGMVTADNVLFRKGASSTADHWARLPKGWTMEIVDTTVWNGKVLWYKVRGGIPSNPNRAYAGYISGDYFTPIDLPQTPTQPPITADSNYGLVTLEGIYIRDAIGGAYIAQVGSNTVVNLIYRPAGNTANDWYYVEVNGIYGYLPATTIRVLSTAELSYYVLPPAPSITPVPYNPGVIGSGYIKLIKDKVNIRKTPGGTVLTPTTESKMKVGTVIAYSEGPVSASMDGKKYDWVKVTYGGIVGYVRSDCYQYCDEHGNKVNAPTSAPSVPTAAPGYVTPLPTDSPSGQGYIKLIKGGVNLRRTPGGESMAQLARNTVLPYYNIVVQGSERWYEVYSAQRGTFGYILTTMAEICDANGNSVAPDPSIPTAAPGTIVGYVATTASSVWLRKTPSTDGETVGQVKAKGSVLTMVGPVVKNGAYEWYPVQTSDGTRAYIRGDFVFALAEWQLEEYRKTGKIATPTPGPATPRPGNSSYIQTTADHLWIRETPSTQAGTLGQLRIGAVVRFYQTRVTGNGTANKITWYQIYYGNRVGWVHGGYVRVLTNAEYDAMNMTPAPTAYVTPGPTSYLTPTSFVPTPSQSPVIPTVYRSLYKNSSGSDVYALQYKLAELGYLAWGDVTGIYLTSTEKAVIAFQKDNKLTVDGIAGKQTQTALYNYVAPGVTATPAPGVTVAPGDYSGSVDVTLYPVEKIDWYNGGIQKIWTVGTVAIITDVYTGISFRAQRLYGDNHADCEPLTTADTAAVCRIYGVSKPQEIEDREQELQSYRRRPLWVTIGGRTFAASMYGIPHNFDGDRIPDNGYNGQFCVHFTNSRTHTTNIVDPDADYNGYFGHQSAIQYAYVHSISGQK